MSERCLKCFRPVQHCYCGDITPIESGVKFVFLMHPREAYRQRTGTGRLAGLSLVGSQIIIGTAFDNDSRTRALIDDESCYPMVLYPGAETHTTDTFDFERALQGRTLLIFLLDATWAQARKMMRRSPDLQRLPGLSFNRPYRSRFSIKTQPETHCLSTIESSYYLLKELQSAGVCDPQINGEGLMTVFEKMVTFQIRCRDTRVGYRWQEQ